MRTTIDLDEDALLLARRLAAREGLSLGQAASRLICRGAAEPVGTVPAEQTFRGRYALLPARDEVITPGQVRDLIEREDI